MEGETRYCAYCGAPLKDDWAFCDACGSRILEDGVEKAGAVAHSPVENPQGMQGRVASKTSKVLSVVGFVLIGLVLVGGLSGIVNHRFRFGSSSSSYSNDMYSYSGNSYDGSYDSYSNSDSYDSADDSYSNSDSYDSADDSYSNSDSYDSAGDSYSNSDSYDSSADASSSDSAEYGEFAASASDDSAKDQYSSDNAADSQAAVDIVDDGSDAAVSDASASDAAADGSSAAEDSAQEDGAQAGAASAAAGTLTSGYLVPDADSRYLTDADTEGFDAQLYCLAKNEVYARHGRLFQSQELQDYFGSQDWYYGFIQPEEFSDTVFNEYEKANVVFLKDHEEALAPGGYVLDQAGYSFDNALAHLKAE